MEILGIITKMFFFLFLMYSNYTDIAQLAFGGKIPSDDSSMFPGAANLARSTPL
jgi:hypothetical protein